MPPINLYGLTRANFEAFVTDNGHQAFRARQLMKWLYHQGITDFSAMTDLSKAQRSWLVEATTCALPEVVSKAESHDGTTKWVIRVANGNCVETVLIPDRGRNTLCVSSQVGCMLDCTFCATGKQGFDGNLTTADIVGQAVIANQHLANRGEAVTNVVFMGMGEPLLNLDAVVDAAELFMDDLSFGLSKRRVTVSTAGVVPGILELATRTDVSLAISLHAPNDDLRNQLVPINRKYPLQTLLEACHKYLEVLGEGRSITIEYTLMKGVNDTLAHAEALAALLATLRCKINLIPFNPFPGSGFARPTRQAVERFQTYLLKRQFPTMLRTTRGDDIAAACGQLVGAVNDRTRRQARYRDRFAKGGTAKDSIVVQTVGESA